MIVHFFALVEALRRRKVQPGLFLRLSLHRFLARRPLRMHYDNTGIH